MDILHYKPAFTAGDDVLMGTTNNDTLEGAGGDDALRGGDGSDTYLYQLGDGRDTLYDASDANDVDILVFAQGIKTSDVKVAVSPTDAQDLILTIGKSGDSIYLDQQLAGKGIEQIKFSDGTIWLTNDFVPPGLTTTPLATGIEDVLYNVN